MDDYDLDLLDEHLSSPDLPDEAMLLTELDGYLTAIALAPHLILPSEWMPEIWGGEQAGFAHMQLANGVYGAIMGLYNDNLRALFGGAGCFEPIFDVDTDGSPLIEIWLQGFVRGVNLRPEEWAALLESDEGEEIFGMFLAVLGNPDGSHSVEMSATARKRLLRRLVTTLPNCLAAIRAFWSARGLGAGGPPPARSDASPRALWLRRQAASLAASPAAAWAAVRVGRNEYCPCGSGKKYKKCCGMH